MERITIPKISQSINWLIQTLIGEIEPVVSEEREFDLLDESLLHPLLRIFEKYRR